MLGQSRLSAIKDDNEAKSRALQRSGIHLTTELNPENSGSRLSDESCATSHRLKRVPYLQMTSVLLHRKSEREKEASTRNPFIENLANNSFLRDVILIHFSLVYSSLTPALYQLSNSLHCCLIQYTRSI